LSFFSVSKLTFREVLKERFFLGILTVEVLSIFACYYLSEIAAGDTVKVAMDFILGFFFFLSSLFVVMVSTSTLFRDLSNKFIYIVLSKPISRESYLFGKYLGVISVYGFFLFLSFFIVTSGMLTISYFANLWVPHVILVERVLFFTFSLFFMGVLLTAFSFLFSTILTSQTLAILVAFLLFLIGLELSPVKELVLSSEYVSPFNKVLIKVLYYFFPNFSLYDLKAPVVHTQLPISVTYLLLLFLYTLLYSGAVLLVTTKLFCRREL